MASALDIIQVIAEMTYLGQQVMNVYHLLSSSAVSDSDVVTDVTTIIDGAYTNIDSILDGSLAPTSLRVLNLTQNEELDLISWPTFTGGTIALAVGLPPGVAALVTYPTNVLGVRGRKFIAGLTENANSDGVIEGAALTTLEDLAVLTSDPFLGTASGDPWSFCVVNEALQPRIITGYQLGNIWAYQRRRRQGTGS